MPPEEPENGRATIREVITMLTALDDKIEAKFKDLDAKYVLRDSCRERHRFIDPRQLWSVGGTLMVLQALLFYILTR